MYTYLIHIDDLSIQSNQMMILQDLKVRYSLDPDRYIEQLRCAYLFCIYTGDNMNDISLDSAVYLHDIAIVLMIMQY